MSAPEDRDLDELAAALDARRADAEALEGQARSTALALFGASQDLHRAGLVRIIRHLREDPRGKELLFELIDEPVVHLLMLSHGLIRPDVTTQAQRVLDVVRPQLQSHGGDVELVRIEGSTVFVRLNGACNGCSMAAVTMREGVEKALKEGVPGITAVEVVANDPGPAIIPLSSIGIRPGAREKGWVRAGALDDFPEGKATAKTLRPDDGASVDALVVHIDGQLTAYVNACAHQGLRMDGTILDTTEKTMRCPWHGFCYDTISGECLSVPGAQLDSLPLRVDDGHVWIRAAN